MVTKTPIQRFTRGLVSDVVGVPDALLEADNVMMGRNGELMVRGGKWAQAANISGMTSGRTAHYCPNLAVGSNEYMGSMNTSSTPQMFAMSSSGALTTAFNTAILDAAGAAIVWAGTTNQAVVGSRHAIWEDEAVFPGLDNLHVCRKWAGAETADYATGTVSGLDGGTTLTGSGGATWTSDHEGMYVYVDVTTIENRMFRIVKVLTSTTIEVDVAFGATFTGEVYRFSSMGWLAANVGIFGNGNVANGVTAPTIQSYVNARVVEQHDTRLFGAHVVLADGTEQPDWVMWSASQGEVGAGTDKQFSGFELWNGEAKLAVAPGEGGSGILAMISEGTNLYVFKYEGVWVIEGTFDTIGLDLGARVTRVLKGDGLIGGEPVHTEDGIYFCGREGIYRMTDTGVTNICEPSQSHPGIRRLYQTMFYRDEEDSGAAALATGISDLSYVNKRLIVHGIATRGTAVTAEHGNTLVLDTAKGVWATQTTEHTTNAVGPQEISLTMSGESSPSKMLRWSADYLHSSSNSYKDGGGSDVLMRVTTHPIKTGQPYGGRVRQGWLRARLKDRSSDDPTFSFSIIPGEQGTTAGNESTVTGAVFAEQNATEKVCRLPVRAGFPIVPSVRLRFIQTAAAEDVRLYGAGVDYVNVRRARN